MILNYTLFGERNSGTNYLRQVLDSLIDVPFTSVYGFKHWYIRDHVPRCRPNTTTDNECIKSIKDHHHTLFVFIVRNPFDWTSAMFRRPYHIPDCSRSNMSEFVTQPYQAYEKNRPPNHTQSSETPWVLDPKTNTYFIEEAKNILELRNVKNNHFYGLKKTVRYFAMVRLENLKEDLFDICLKTDIQHKIDWDHVLKDYIPPNSYEVNDACRRQIINGLDNIVDNNHYL